MNVNIVLSVIVISHEQRELLRRCVDSILDMQMPYPWEIIISDDRSTDGTYELAQEYAEKYKELSYFEVANTYRPRIIALQCNSEKCNPAYNSQRSAYNRCNAYPHATGKYMAYVDADDYFQPGATVYSKQIEALEKHSECALAMSNCWYAIDGEPLEKATKLTDLSKYKDGDVISADDYIQDIFFHLNQAFIQRRIERANPVELYGKTYTDSVITAHHLQYGSIVYVEACDYMYIQYENSITGKMQTSNHDSDIMWCLGLYIPCLIPTWRTQYYKKSYMSIKNVINMALSGYKLQPQHFKALSERKMFIYKCFGKELTVLDKLHLKLMKKWINLQHRKSWYGNFGAEISWLLFKY